MVRRSHRRRRRRRRQRRADARARACRFMLRAHSDGARRWRRFRRRERAAVPAKRSTVKSCVVLAAADACDRRPAAPAPAALAAAAGSVCE